MNKIILLIFFIFITNALYSQQFTKEQIIEDLAEQIASNSDNDDLDISEITEDLEFFYDNPLNLNSATLQDLQRLHFLDNIQIYAILGHVKKYGIFQSFYELQLLDGFDMETIQKLIPFVTIAPPKNHVNFDLKKALTYGRNQVFVRWQTYLEPMAGYNIPDSVIVQNPDKSRYLGDPNKIWLKYAYKYKDQIHWGLTAEKDAGEQFFNGAQKYGFDFYSAHLQIAKIGILKSLVIGDFQAQFGEGLTMWSGLAFGKSAMVMNVKKKARGLRYYSSSDENFFLRGIGTTINLGKNFELSAFASYHKIDANLTIPDSLNNLEIDNIDITSILSTGYHRTPSEIENRHALGQTVFGANVNYHGDRLIAGLTFVDYSFSGVVNTIKYPYQFFNFQGTSSFNVGLNYQYDFKKFYFFGETSMSPNGGIATLNAITVPLDHRFKLAVLYRNYSAKFQGYFSSGFVEGSSISNEKGIYIGAEIDPIAKVKISTYVDYFTFSWLKYQLNDVFSNGIDYFCQFDFNPSHRMNMYIRYRHQIKPQNISSSLYDVPVIYAVDKNTWSLRYYFAFQVNKNISLKTRFDFTSYSKADTNETGFMIYQDFNYKFIRVPLSFNFRYAMFDAPYDARMYAYESDVLYAFSVPAYFYKGFRVFFVAKYLISPKLAIWFKIARTTYTDRNVISSGLNQIDANHKTEVKLQIRYKF